MPINAGLWDALQPERSGETHFCGHSLPLASPAIFGGQLMAQVLSVASATLPEPRSAHYLQTNFLTFGDPSLPLEFSVTIIRDGRTTSHRNVLVTQGERTLLTASVSFQDNIEGFSHATQMPEAATPERLIDEGAKELFLSTDERPPFPFRILDCNANEKTVSPESAVWAVSREAAPTDAHRQQMLFAFFSDATILQSALQPHQLDWEAPGISIATMNHSIWFHQPIDVNDWILLHSVSPHTGGGRALSIANAFSRSGELIASVAQEGILRSQG